jgi:hypothetical protein
MMVPLFWMSSRGGPARDGGANGQGGGQGLEHLHEAVSAWYGSVTTLSGKKSGW